MFSRDDLGRGTRWPLAWVFIPLIVGALLITAIGAGIQATMGFPDNDLAERIEAAGTGSRLDQRTEFEWDRVCVFPPDLPSEAVDEGLGMDWGRTGGHPLDDLLLVFVRDGEVITHTFVDPRRLEPPPAEGDCRSPDDDGARIRTPTGP